MGLEHLAAVWEHSRQGGSHLTVLLAIASYSDQDGEWVIDQATLQRRARLGQRRIQQILAELIAAGELEIDRGDGRGRISTYRLLLGVEKGEGNCTLSPEKGEAGCTLSAAAEEKGEEDCTLSAQKGEADCTLSPEKGEADCTLSAAAEEKGEAACTLSAQKGEAGCTLSPGSFPPTPPLSPVRQEALRKEAEETADKTAEESFALGLRPLTDTQSAIHRVRRLLDEAGLTTLPSPAQAAVWVKALGLEPLLDLLGRLSTAGLARKDDPLRYAHRVVTDEARRGPVRKPPLAGGRAGLDDARQRQALRLLKRGAE